jgi:hypothetical protein
MQLKSKVAVSPHSLQPHIDPHHTASEHIAWGRALVSADHISPTLIPLTSLFPASTSPSSQLSTSHQNSLPPSFKPNPPL